MQIHSFLYHPSAHCWANMYMIIVYTSQDNFFYKGNKFKFNTLQCNKLQHCKNSGVQCTPNHLHTYGVLTHLSLMVCNTHQIFGVLTHLLLKVCNTHQILGLLTHTVTEGVHYTPNIWCAKHTLSLKVCITHQTFSVLTHCVTEGVHYTPSVLNTPCH